MSQSPNLTKYDRNMAAAATAEDAELRWHDADTPGFRLSGFAFRRPGGKFRRMPEAGPGVFPEAIERLSWCTSGGNLAFITDSSTISVRAKLHQTYRSYHLTALICGGFDIYEGPPEARHFITSGSYDIQNTEYTSTLIANMTREKREFLIDFPLYGGIDSLEIGLDDDAVIAPPSPWKDPRPVIFYGSSITQGACAGRPGLSPTNILGRRWNVPVLNFGFSGSGKGEKEVVEAIVSADPDPRMFVLDYAANSVIGNILFDTLERSIGIIRRKFPRVPIALPSLSNYSRFEVIKKKTDNARKMNDAVNVFIRETAEKYRKAGDENVFFVNSRLADHYDDWTECSTDGLHLNDLGFYRTAELWAEQMKEVIS